MIVKTYRYFSFVLSRDIKFQCWKFSYVVPKLKAAFHLQVFKHITCVMYSVCWLCLPVWLISPVVVTSQVFQSRVYESLAVFKCTILNDAFNLLWFHTFPNTAVSCYLSSSILEMKFEVIMFAVGLFNYGNASIISEMCFIGISKTIFVTSI